MSRAALLLAALGLLALIAPTAWAGHGGPIRIANDADFASSPHFVGAGTLADPYRLASTAAIVASGGYGIELVGTSKHVNLSGLTIAGGSAHSDGIRILSAANVTVHASTLETNRIGIVVTGSHNVTLVGNTVKTSQTGVHLESSRDVTLRDNRISLNDKDVAFRNARANTLVNNNLSIATGQYGLFFEDNASYDNSIDTTNVVNAIPIRWYSRLAGTPSSPIVLADVTVDLDRMTNVAQIMLHNASHVRLDRPVAKAGHGAGIHVFQGQSIELARPTAEGNGAQGIFVERSTGTRISNASARENTGPGILLQSSNDTIVETSTLSANKLHGLRMAAASDLAQLRHLTLSGNLGGGVRIEASSNATLESSTLSSNGVAAVALSDARDAAVRATNVTGTGPVGVSLTRSPAKLEGNTIQGHTQAISFGGSIGANATGNIITLVPGGTGFWFDGPGSYDNALAPSNLVNGTPLRWYTNVVGTTPAPVVLPDLRVEAAGITNVAQIMLYKTANVTLTAPHAKNGTAAGIVLYQSSTANVSSAAVAANAVHGVLAHESYGPKVLGSTIAGSGGDGIKLVSSPGALVENNVVSTSRGRGMFVETSDAPTLRGNAISGNTGIGIHLDRVGPGGAAIDNNVLQNNGGGLSASGSAVGSVRSNTLTNNTADGISLVSVPVGARLEWNNITGHARGIRLAQASGTTLVSNAIVKSPAQTGVHFDDEASYNVTLPPSNTVEGSPIRWYVSAGAPATIADVRAEVPGMTNVAQVMLYKVANVTLTNAVASNGSARGIHVFRSENVTVDASLVENNTRAGIDLDASRDVRVRGTTTSKNVLEGIRIDKTDRPRIDNVTGRSNARGIVLTDSPVALVDNATLADNGAVGISFTASAGSDARSNVLTNHTRGFELVRVTGIGFLLNRVTIATGQTGWHFADEESYASTVGTTNLVNDVPMRWYSGVNGLSLQGVRAEVRGMTNVAQVMLHASNNATLTDVVAANGTADGLLVIGSSNVLVKSSHVANNTLDGLELRSGSTLTVRNSTFRDNGGHGARIAGVGPHRLDNATFASNRASGALLEATTFDVMNALAENNSQGGIHASRSDVNISVSTFRANGREGLFFDRTTGARSWEGSFMDNAPAGLRTDQASGVIRIRGNAFTNHTRAIELSRTEFAEIHANVVSIGPDQTGLHFADEQSYNNVVGTSNTVNGAPVHWYTTLAGTETQPIVIPNVRSEVRGVTNVAQVMLYRSAYVELPGLVATNGTARGVYLHRSSSITLDNATASNNSLHGVHLHSTQSSTLRSLRAQNVTHGVELTASANNVVAGVNATGSVIGVRLADAASRDNRVERIDVNGSARGILDTAWAGQTTLGNNLLADAGAFKRGKVAAEIAFTDTTTTYRLDSDRIVEQTWTWGDGTPSVSSTAPALLRPVHAYATAGLYQANVSLLTASGITLTDSVHVDVVPPLSVPRALVAGAGARNITLTWTPPEFDGASPITKYRIYRGPNASSVPFLLEVPGSSSLHVDTGLENGRPYVYYVSAVNADGEGPKATATATPVAPPGPPQALKADPRPAGALLNWSAPTDGGGLPITGYVVMRSLNGSAWLTAATLGNVTTFTDAGLVNGQKYHYAVLAVNAQGSGALSSNATVVPVGPPGPPALLQALSGDASATLVWSAPADTGGTPITGYRVWRGASNATLVPLSDVVPANASSFRHTGLSNGQPYVFAVSAVNAQGQGERSATLGATPEAVDSLRPVVFDLKPLDGAIMAESPAEIAAQFVDNDGIDKASVRVFVDDAQVGANVTDAGFAYPVPTALARGAHTVRVVVRDPSGNEANVSWSFRIIDESERAPLFRYHDHALAPARVAPGANVTAVAMVHNAGFLAGNATLSVRLLDNALAHVSLPVAPQETVEAHVEFVAPTVLGVYELTFAGATLTLHVVDPDEPEQLPEGSPGEPDPVPEPAKPTRPVRGTPSPRPEDGKEVPLPGLAILVGGIVVAALRRPRGS